MVTLKNCNLIEAEKKLKGKRIVLFGAGSWLNTIDYTRFMNLADQFAYVIDNNPKGNVVLGKVELEVKSPDYLYMENDCVVLLTSPVYMYDMYCQLKDMNLKGNIECYSFPFMQMISNLPIDNKLAQKVMCCKEPKIPKKIHSFWFSGEPKPEIYQKCVESWKEILVDYQFIEWNQDNYDCYKHPFLEKAISVGAWAFATDYARLDVLNTYGGIYLDMDVLVYKPFDVLLGNEAILSFSNNVQIDLAVLAAQKESVVIKKILEIYDDISIPKSKEEFSKFFQPALVKPVLASLGVKMDGTLQKGDGWTAFPSSFFMPQEHILFNEFDITENTFCNHLDNFGWSFSTQNKREKKIRDNRLLWEMID